MNANPSAKRILLYGDSLVFGKASGPNKRLSGDVRFSVLLQKQLGNDYEIIEEGLRARTLEGENAIAKHRNGLEQFPSVLGSHLPLDLVIIMLGTNDCNATAQKTPQQIAEGLRNYPPIIGEWAKHFEVPLSKILIVAPPRINQNFYDELMGQIFGPEAGEKAAALPALYQIEAKNLKTEFLDISKVCEPAKGDGVHLDESGNKAVADSLQAKVLEVFE